MLSQAGKPRAYVSRVLNAAEQNYGIKQKETLAALWSMTNYSIHFRKNFKLVTDHKAMEQIKAKVNFGFMKTQRWSSGLAMFDFGIRYRKAKHLWLQML